MDNLESIEFARVAAWADAGHTDIDNPPEGWPEGVDADAYTSNFVDRYVPKTPITPIVEKPSTLITHFRNKINGC